MVAEMTVNVPYGGVELCFDAVDGIPQAASVVGDGLGFYLLEAHDEALLHRLGHGVMNPANDSQ